MRQTEAGLVLVLVLGIARSASADTASEADALFEQGMTDLASHQVEKACTELAASQAKRPDIATQAALADCYTQLGKTASAWRLWHDLAASAPAKLRAEAARNATNLESRVPHLTIALPPAAPEATIVTVNGEAVSIATGPLAVDPGPIEVVATAPGYQPVSRRESITEGQALTIAITALIPLPDAGPLPPGREPGPGAKVLPTRDRRLHVEGRAAYSVLRSSFDFSSNKGDGYTGGGATVPPDPDTRALEVGALVLVAPTAWLGIGGGIAYRHLAVNFDCDNQDHSTPCISDLASHSVVVPLVARGVRRFGDWDGSVSVGAAIGARSVWYAAIVVNDSSEADFTHSPQLVVDLDARVAVSRAVGAVRLFVDVGYERSLRSVQLINSDEVGLSYGGLAIGAGVTY